MRKLVHVLTVLLLSLSAIAQQRTITGIVTDPNNTPIAGASITVRGTQIATQTDAEGNFSIAVPQDATLVASFVGMGTTEVALGTQDRVTITLSPTTGNNLTEVVVTGYQTQRKADLTGAVAVVDMSELNKTPVVNPMQSLQGRVPGMYVRTDGSPSGSNANVQIRGLSSINGSGNVPLLVIDGVPTKGGMHELNPNDIESIQVLKDASSASIYGSRASAGVIIITTKKAKKGQLSVTANARRSWAFYQNRMEVLDAEGYGRAVWQASANDAGAYGTNVLDRYLVYGFDWLRGTNGEYLLNKINLPEFIDAPNNTIRTSNTDWFKEISQTAVYENYDVQVSRGTDKGSTVFSLDYTNNEGIVKTTEFRRISARINSDYRLLNNKLVIGENFTANTTREVGGNVLNAALQALPVIPVRTVDGIGWGGPWGGMNDRQNPVRLLEDNKQNHYDFIRLLGNAYADLELIKGLHLRSSLGLDYGNFTSRNMQLSYVSGYLNDPINRVTMNNSNSTKLIWTNTANYKREFGKHDIDGLLGTEVYKENNVDFFARRQNFASEDPNFMYLGAGTGLQETGGGADRIHLLSYFGRVNYGYNEKYLASATLRYDGSSKFGRNNQFGFFPAFSLGWRLSQEAFIQDNLEFISDLKLRYGWGQTGSQDPIPSAANRTLYTTNYGGTSYDFLGTGTGTLPSGYQLVQRSNEDVRWETTTQSNIGLDFGLLNQKIYGSVDYFVKNTSDMLIQPAYIGVIGEGGSRWVNGASLRNEELN